MSGFGVPVVGDDDAFAGPQIVEIAKKLIYVFYVNLLSEVLAVNNDRQVETRDLPLDQDINLPLDLRDNAWASNIVLNRRVGKETLEMARDVNLVVAPVHCEPSEA
jgi:predicted protein tyrosine phosphatase